MIKAILLDFNGVIIDDEQIQLEAYREILKADGIEITDADYMASLGMNDKAFVTAAYKRAGIEPETNRVLEVTLAKTNKWRETVASQMPLFDGVENFIRKMSQELSLGIVSMAKREEIEFVLDATGLKDSISIIVSSEVVRNYKPDPECYREGFRRLDLSRMAKGHLAMDHGDCLAIEDSPAGVLAAKAAHLNVLGITNTVEADRLREAGADAVSKRLDDWMPESVRRVFV